MSHNWMAFTTYWAIAAVFLCLWHVLTYVRIHVPLIVRRVPYTGGAAICMVLITAAIVWVAGIRNVYFIAALVILGFIGSMRLSIALHIRAVIWERADRLQREQYLDDVSPGGMRIEQQSGADKKPWKKARVVTKEVMEKLRKEKQQDQQAP